MNGRSGADYIKKFDAEKRFQSGLPAKKTSTH